MQVKHKKSKKVVKKKVAKKNTPKVKELIPNLFENRVIVLDAQLAQMIFRVKALESKVLALESQALTSVSQGYSYVMGDKHLDPTSEVVSTLTPLTETVTLVPSTPKPCIESGEYRHHFHGDKHGKNS